MEAPQEAGLFELADVILALGRQIQAAKEPAGELTGGSWTPLEAAVMRFVDRHPGATAGEAAAATHLISSNTSRALRNLEHKGLIRRAADESDARRVRLYPTDQARENLRRLHVVWSRLLEGTVRDSAELGAVTATLRRIEAQLIDRARHDTGTATAAHGGAPPGGGAGPTKR